ncbi:MAG: flippase-like domain-containing protein [Candidatus Omnitrophica bacterium]|jgi:uncharacterized protein (TIRG00374 family)|nr:flippase-like domain-containing protein [Candidatus Omnitrophota bacterium]
MGSNLLRILISIAFLAFFAWSFRDNYGGVALALRHVDFVALGVGFVLVLTSGFLMGWRLRLVFRAQGLLLGIKDAVHLTFVGLFFNNFLPSAVGGDLVKAYCASLVTGKRVESFSACLMDRILGLFIFILIPSLTVLFLVKELDHRVPAMVLGALVLACIGLWLIFNKHHVAKLSFLTAGIQNIPGVKKLGELYHAMHELTKDKGLVLRICIVAAAGQFLNIFSIWWILKALSASAELHQLLIRTPLVHLFGMLPSFGGLGLREKGFEYFFSPIVGHETSGALAILFLFFLILMSAIGGVVYMFRHDLHFNFKNLKNTPEAA